MAAHRCAVCGWPLAADVGLGCVPGNCSMRPLPPAFCDPARAKREYAPLLDHDPRVSDEVLKVTEAADDET